MPKHVRTIKYYTCDFKCGHPAASELRITQHEEKCYCNPANKSCRVCANCCVEDKFLVCKAKDLYFRIEKKQPGVEGKVFDKDMNVVWATQEIPQDLDSYAPWILLIKVEKIIENNLNRPFPTKNCSEFKLGKKVY